jgi:hypothetical protein
VDLGSCFEASYVVSMDGFASVEECECKFSNCLLVVLAEFVKVFVELGNLWFCLNVVGYVLWTSLLPRCSLIHCLICCVCKA